EAELTGSGYSTRMRAALLCLETTHNAAGGTVLGLDYLAAVKALAAAHGTAVHIDGARVFNAAVALGVPIARIAQHTDTITFCLSKGLGAPVGSILCGDSAVITRARRFRKQLGGTLRQAGVIAAAGLVALETMVDRLADDHRRARRLAEGLAALDPGLCDPAGVETNIVYLDLSSSGISAADWSNRLGGHGILCRPYSTTRMRLLTHADIAEDDIDRALAAFRAIWQAAPRRAA
ncbi:MAG TPA: GntG family PLP-dependent aldolase, partial [Roseomonas sp.]